MSAHEQTSIFEETAPPAAWACRDCGHTNPAGAIFCRGCASMQSDDPEPHVGPQIGSNHEIEGAA